MKLWPTRISTPLMPLSVALSGGNRLRLGEASASWLSRQGPPTAHDDKCCGEHQESKPSQDAERCRHRKTCVCGGTIPEDRGAQRFHAIGERIGEHDGANPSRGPAQRKERA